MPIYNYKCSKCQSRFELLVGVTADSNELKCTECGSTDIEKQLSTFSVGSSSQSQPDCASGSCPTSPCATGTCPTRF
ncbi:zinc ribbon domain-containing protein [Acidobacteriota bacterium]